MIRREMAGASWGGASRCCGRTDGILDSYTSTSGDRYKFRVYYDDGDKRSEFLNEDNLQWRLLRGKASSRQRLKRGRSSSVEAKSGLSMLQYNLDPSRRHSIEL